MNIVITGGAGFIGSNISKLAIEHGHKVKVVDNLSTGYSENLEGLDIDFIEGDIRDETLMKEVLKSQDVVIHTAASVGNIKSLEDPKTDCLVNYVGTLCVLEAMRINGVNKIIYSSSSAAYGEPEYLPIDERHLLAPQSPYGVSKMAAEKLILAYSLNYQMVAVCLRYFNAYGVNQRFDAYGNVIPIFCKRILQKEPLIIYGEGEQTRDFVEVSDIALANLSAIQCKKSDFYNIASGKSITINQLIEALREVTEIDFDVIKHKARKGEVMHSSSDISSAMKSLSFEPKVPIKQGLRRYFDWFKSEFS